MTSVVYMVLPLLGATGLEIATRSTEEMWIRYYEYRSSSVYHLGCWDEQLRWMYSYGYVCRRASSTIHRKSK